MGAQVFDLGKHRPDQVLEAIWKNFGEHESRDPARVKALRERLRIVVAGGDGTVGWTLQVRAATQPEGLGSLLAG